MLEEVAEADYVDKEQQYVDLREVCDWRFRDMKKNGSVDVGLWHASIVVMKHP